MEVEIGNGDDKTSMKQGVQLICAPPRQTLNHYITYSIISSEPALTFTSAVSTIRCFEVTSGPHAGGTFVQWSGNFSSDADAGTLSTRGPWS